MQVCYFKLGLLYDQSCCFYFVFFSLESVSHIFSFSFKSSRKLSWTLADIKLNQTNMMKKLALLESSGPLLENKENSLLDALPVKTLEEFQCFDASLELTVMIIKDSNN